MNEGLQRVEKENLHLKQQAGIHGTKIESFIKELAILQMSVKQYAQAEQNQKRDILKEVSRNNLSDDALYMPVKII